MMEIGNDHTAMVLQWLMMEADVTGEYVHLLGQADWSR